MRWVKKWIAPSLKTSWAIPRTLVFPVSRMGNHCRIVDCEQRNDQTWKKNIDLAALLKIACRVTGEGVGKTLIRSQQIGDDGRTELEAAVGSAQIWKHLNISKQDFPKDWIWKMKMKVQAWCHGFCAEHLER